MVQRRRENMPWGAVVDPSGRIVGEICVAQQLPPDTNRSCLGKHPDPFCANYLENS